MPQVFGTYLVRPSTAINDGWEASGSRRYRVGVTPDADEVFVRKNCGFQINYPHPSDPSQVVSNISVEMEQDELSQFNDPTPGTGPSNPANGSLCYWWAVDISYGPWDPLQHTATGNPADQPPEVAFQWQVFEEAADYAYTPGTTTIVPVVNSAGDPFDPPVTREMLKGILRVSWNSLTFNPASFFGNGNCINSDTFWGFAPYTIKFGPPNMPQRLWSQYLQRNYWRLESEFAFNPDVGGWNATPIDRGFNQVVGGNKSKIFDVNGQPVSVPALLNGSGVPLTSLTGVGYYQWNYQIYKAISFSSTFQNLVNLFNS